MFPSSIDSILTASLIVLTLASNCLAALPLVMRLRKGVWPRIADFGAVSLLVFYGVGLLAELGSSESSSPLTPLFAGFESTKYATLALIALAPWILHLGSMCVNTKIADVALTDRVELSRRCRSPFLFAVIAICSLIAAQGIAAWLSAPSIWAVRAQLGERWGQWIIWFYIPLYLLAFVASTTEVRSRTGRAAFYSIAILSVCASIPVGQRTLVLLPLVIVFMFSNGLSLKRALLVPAIAVVFAVLLLPVFKWQFGEGDLSLGQKVASSIQSDTSRARALSYTLSRAEVAGSYLMPYPMAGYVYSLAFFVPRSIAPWKGYSTAQFFTADVVGGEVAPITWGLGLGAMEEILVNAGALFVVPGLFAYGLLMGLMDRLSERVPSLLLPTRLATLWVGGYHIPALLLTFGPMIVVSTVLAALLRNPTALGSPARSQRRRVTQFPAIAGNA